MTDLLLDVIRFIADTALGVLPIILFLFLFQRLLIGGKIPNLGQIVLGLVFVVIGLGLFLLGLEQSLFPLGRVMAEQLTDPHFLSPASGATVESLAWQDFYWVYLFGASVGFSAAMAEPALIAVSMKANTVSGGAIHVLSLRVAVAIGVAIGVALGCYRIVADVPLHHFIVACYLIVIVQTIAAPRLIVPLAYDSGGVTTSTVTVPLITALGLGLAESLPGRSPLLDGFGMVAVACLFPIMTVLAYGQLALIYQRTRSGKE